MTFTQLKAAVLAAVRAKWPDNHYCSVKVEDTHFHEGEEQQEWTIYTSMQANFFQGPTPEAAFESFMADLRSVPGEVAGTDTSLIDVVPVVCQRT